MEGFPGDVDVEVVRVNHSHNVRQVFRNEFGISFSEEDSTSIESELVFAGVVVVVEVEGDAIRDVKNRGEDDFSFRIEMDPVHGGIRLFADAFVEVDVVLFVYIVLVSQPQSFVCINSLPFPNFSLHLFS